MARGAGGVRRGGIAPPLVCRISELRTITLDFTPLVVREEDIRRGAGEGKGVSEMENQTGAHESASQVAPSQAQSRFSRSDSEIPSQKESEKRKREGKRWRHMAYDAGVGRDREMLGVCMCGLAQTACDG